MPDSSAEEFACRRDDEKASCAAEITPEHVPPDGPEGPREGLWLTAMACLPPEFLAAGAVGPAGFGQGGLLDQLAPGPVLATFTAEAAGPLFDRAGQVLAGVGVKK